jgi:hypothetical protein
MREFWIILLLWAGGWQTLKWLVKGWVWFASHVLVLIHNSMNRWVWGPLGVR